MAASVSFAAFAVLMLATLAAAANTRNPASGKFNCPASYGNFPHDTYCDLYWQCRSGVAYLSECEYDWLFDKKLTLCDEPRNVDCGTLITPPTQPTTTDDGTTRSTRTTPMEEPSTEEPTTRTTTERTTTTPQRTTPGPFVCPSNDGRYPDPASCDHYYVCVGGTGILQECGVGTWFNPQTSGCEFPGDFCVPPMDANERANQRQNSQLNRLLPTKHQIHRELLRRGDQPHQVERLTWTPQITTPRPFVCPAPEGLYPDPASCDHFYICREGVAYLEHCPRGTMWNPQIQGCDFPGSYCVPPTGANGGGQTTGRTRR